MRRFEDCAAFSKHLNRLASRIPTANRNALRPAAEAIRDEAKAMLGTYQGPNGEIPGWQQLTEATQRSRERAGFTPNEPLKRSGDLQKSIECSQQEDKAAIGSAMPLAKWMEKGVSGHIPARPFLAMAGARLSKDVASYIGDSFVSYLAGKPVGKMTTGKIKS